MNCSLFQTATLAFKTPTPTLGYKSVDVVDIPSPGSAQGHARQGLGQPALVEGVSALGKGDGDGDRRLEMSFKVPSNSKYCGIQ